MREILFRGKRADNGEWVEGAYYKQDYFYDDEVEKHIIITSRDTLTNDFDLDFYEVIPETLGQFTGLHDKNGKRIWENDIVKTKFGRLCKMIWRQTQCFVGWDFLVCDFEFGVNDFSKPPSSWDLYLPENLEVVGNRFDNPELLTAERSE